MKSRAALTCFPTSKDPKVMERAMKRDVRHRDRTALFLDPPSRKLLSIKSLRLLRSHLKVKKKFRGSRKELWMVSCHRSNG